MVISGVDLFQSPRGRRAKAARKWFAENGPADLQPLPLGYSERETLKAGGAPHILAWYARSLASLHYDFLTHPSFDDYARGVMASEFGWDTVKHDIELQRRFPPRHLDGLGPGLYWLPPKEHAEEMASLRRSLAWKKLCREGRHDAVVSSSDTRS
jgi:hypothetical protein